MNIIASYGLSTMALVFPYGLQVLSAKICLSDPKVRIFYCVHLV